MELLLYMVVSAVILEGLVFFARGNSFHSSAINGLSEEFETDGIIAFITLLFGYVIVVACMPLIIFYIIKD